MRVLVTGGAGQLGAALCASAPTGYFATGVARNELDICDRKQVFRVVTGFAPDVVINTAAFTDVDAAEAEKARAFAVNAQGVQHLREAAEEARAQLVQISTDFVFDGGRSSAYPPDAAASPLNEYGRSKLEGELVAGYGALLIRTSWLYGGKGRNFVNTMLACMQKRSELGVVMNQIGSPTLACDLADAIWRLVDAGETGVHHFSNSGVASWYDFAIAIQDEADAAGLLSRVIPIRPVRACDYPTLARRPSFSVLDCTQTYAAIGGPARHWRGALREMIGGLARNG